MSSNNKFCPDCSTLLHPVERLSERGDDKEDDEEFEEGLYLVCKECSYSEKTNTFSTIHFTKKVEKTQYVHPKRIISDYVYDMTFPRTKSKQCANSKCPSRDGDNTEIVLITAEEHPEIAYLCTICKYTWGKL